MSTLEISREKFMDFTSFLEEVGIPAQIYEPDENNVINQLLIPLNLDKEDYPIIQAMFVEDVLEVSGSIIKNPDETFVLQFFVPLALGNIKNTNVTEIHLFLAFLNKMVPIGYFGYGAEGIFYRHTVVTARKNMDKDAFVETIRLISFFNNRFYERVSDLANCIKTRDELLKELDEEIKGLNLG
ncbi:MAG: hypothetical protein U0457_14975 [Candidatus Sericytochromatia bacterium]